MNIRRIGQVLSVIIAPGRAIENRLLDTVFVGEASWRRSGRRPSESMRDANVADQGMSGSAHDRLAQPRAVRRERFVDVRRLVIPDPAPADPSPARNEEWARRKGEVRFWQRSARNRLRLEVDQHAHTRAAQALAEAKAGQREQQELADASWEALSQGEPDVLTAALKAAFADNPAPVAVIGASGSAAVLVVVLPRHDEVAHKSAHASASGRYSDEPWMVKKLNDAYAELLGAHLLATARETWACAPSLTTLRIVGVREGVGIGGEILFDIDTERAHGPWTADSRGQALLEQSEWGLSRDGVTSEVQPWPSELLRPDAIGLCLGQLGQ